MLLSFIAMLGLMCITGAPLALRSLPAGGRLAYYREWRLGRDSARHQPSLLAVWNFWGQIPAAGSFFSSRCRVF
jgi:hypothetical protein